ncbi:MAG: Methylase involved in ubiquinone/menaquinone biosynthesis [Rhodobacteraceae bacterium HLUCCA09]|nr:MAG: Methylase involved in ubiquinone/menaquinone biosynthesis [Rhodobacteraceae bacterium HLUCCA09]
MADARFWDRVADRYARRPIDDPAAYEATLERVRAHLRAEDRALEIGCGTGATALLLAPSVATYHATDLSPRMIGIAQGKPEAQALPQLSFAVAEGVPDGGGPWDAVLAFNALHLLDDLPGALRAIHAGLRPGGRLISKTPCFSDLALWIGVLVPVLRVVGLAPPVRFYSARGLERAIEAAGFRVVETGDYPARRAQRLIVAERA